MTWSSTGEGAGLAEQVRRQRFSMAMRGYAVAEVDRFLDALAEGIDRLQRVSWQRVGIGGRVLPRDLPTADDIRYQTFTVAPNGYAMVEVDGFLDGIIDAVTLAWSRLESISSLPQPAAALELAAPPPGGLTSAAVRAAEFPRAFRGYARKQVDEFLMHAAETLDRLDAALDGPASLTGRVRPAGLTEADVQRAGFFVALRGYAMPRVDDFLDRIAEALAARDRLFVGDAVDQAPPADRQ